jgi:type I restriction-modification system DNA methylase subunit
MDEESSKRKIQELIEKYNRILEEDRVQDYNEEMTKIGFILPLFRALGWDDENSLEVSAEETISRKRVDYGFRINGIPKFFLEAKALKADLNDRNFIEQAIDYAWTKGCTWAVLSNFHTVMIFNAEWKTENLLQNLLKSITYREFLDRFDELSLLSRESLEKGLIDKEAEKQYKKTKLAPIDQQLLDDFSKWRNALSKDILSHNPRKKLTEDELDEAVQRLLNRLVFIRKAEDARLEGNVLLSTLRGWESDSGKPLYVHLVELFRKFNSAYDSELFEEALVDAVVITNSMLKEVITGLYETKERLRRYDFSIIDADVLGNVYEQYLGHILKKTRKRAVVKENHVHRKEQGIYYTPTYVVDYIVRNTLAKILESGKVKFERIKILDSACGSGSFLIKAFDVLNEYYGKHDLDYAQTQLDSSGQGPTFTKKVKILQDHIFGVDLDKQAVEIARLNLLLKIAEKGRRLPLLRQNIKCGNSLIDDEKIAGGKAFKWEEEFEAIMKEGGFDALVGNPPWVFTRGEHFSDLEKEYFDSYLSERNIIQPKKGKNIQSGKLNLYSLFILRSIDLMKNGSVLGFIVPNNILRTTTYDIVRKYILDNCKILSVVDLSIGVFEGVTASTIILLVQKEIDKRIRDENEIQIISDITDLKSEKYKEQKMEQRYYYQNPSFTFNILASPESVKLSRKIEESTRKLGSLCKYIIEGIVASRERDVADKKLNDSYKPFLVGKDIGRYKINYRGKWICYDRRRLHRARPEEVFLSNKILIQRISGGSTPLVAALDEDKRYTFASINNIVLKGDVKYSLRYILALLNSRLLNWYYATNFSNKSELTVNVSKTFLQEIPIKTLSESQQQPLIQLANKMLVLNSRLSEIGDKKTEERAKIEEEISKTDVKIDGLIYEIYGINEAEKEIIKST